MAVWRCLLSSLEGTETEHYVTSGPSWGSNHASLVDFTRWPRMTEVFMVLASLRGVRDLVFPGDVSLIRVTCPNKNEVSLNEDFVDQVCILSLEWQDDCYVISGPGSPFSLALFGACVICYPNNKSNVCDQVSEEQKIVWVLRFVFCFTFCSLIQLYESDKTVGKFKLENVTQALVVNPGTS